jgi:hypothetical protein
MKLEFSRQIYEKLKHQISWEPVQCESMRTDGQTDMIKLILTFRNFANAPNKRLAEWNHLTKVTDTESFNTTYICRIH